MIRTVITVLLFFSLSDGIACQSYEDLDDWAKNDPEFLSQYKCTTIHMEIDKILINGEFIKVIELAESLEKKGIKDRYILQKKAQAYAGKNQYQLAILNENKALEANYVCELTIQPCGLNFGYSDHALTHYRIADYYKKLNNSSEQFRNLQKGDVFLLNNFLRQKGIRLDKFLSEPELVHQFKDFVHRMNLDSVSPELKGK